MSTENYDLADEHIEGDLSDLDVVLVEDELVEHFNRTAQDDPWYAAWAWEEWSHHTVVEEVEGLGTVEVVQVTEGRVCEDASTIVFRVANEEGDVVRHFAVDGAYCSDLGTVWDGNLYEVVPSEKLITVYTRL